MRIHALGKPLLFSTLAALILVPEPVSAQPARRGGAFGDWLVKIDYDGRQMESIVALSRDREGNQTGQWISFWGANDLRDVEYQEGKLSFAWDRRNRDGETTTSKFTGTVADGVLTGTMVSPRGEYGVEGKRSPRMPRAAGSWQMTLKMNDREFTSTLVVAAEQDGSLSGQWLSQWGENEVTDVVYERGSLRFKRKTKMQDREWESTFEGAIQGDTLSGTIRSERGELEVAGTRVGAPLIGTWNLEVTSERGARQQRLRVQPDMSGLYGALPIEKIVLEDGQVSFKTMLQFGDQEFEMSFAGKVTESELAGELTTARGSQQVKGTKVARRAWRRNAQ